MALHYGGWREGLLSTGSKACANCNASLPGEVVFCPACGSYQGQPDVDTGAKPAGAPAVPTPPLERGLRACPHCGATVSDIATACSNCFQALTPTAAPSGPELKPASRGLVWIMVGGAVLILVAWIALEVLNMVVAAHH